MIKTRLQVYDLQHPISSDAQPLLNQSQQPTRPSTLSIARNAYRNEGVAVFFRGIGICSARAFVVNAVQWAVCTFFENHCFMYAANTGLFVGLRVDDEGIERRHCLIRLQDRQFHMQDHCIHLIGLMATGTMPGLMVVKYR